MHTEHFEISHSTGQRFVVRSQQIVVIRQANPALLPYALLRMHNQNVRRMSLIPIVNSYAFNTSSGYRSEAYGMGVYNFKISWHCGIVGLQIAVMFERIKASDGRCPNCPRRCRCRPKSPVGRGVALYNKDTLHIKH